MDRARQFLKSKSSRGEDFRAAVEIDRKNKVNSNRDYSDLFGDFVDDDDEAPARGTSTSYASGSKSVQAHRPGQKNSNAHDGRLDRAKSGQMHGQSQGRSAHNSDSRRPAANGTAPHSSRQEQDRRPVAQGSSAALSKKPMSMSTSTSAHSSRDYSDLFGDSGRPSGSKQGKGGAGGAPSSKDNSSKSKAGMASGGGGSASRQGSSSGKGPRAKGVPSDPKIDKVGEDNWRRQYEREREARIKEEERCRMLNARCVMLEDQLKQARRTLQANGLPLPKAGLVPMSGLAMSASSGGTSTNRVESTPSPTVHGADRDRHSGAGGTWAGPKGASADVHRARSQPDKDRGRERATPAPGRPKPRSYSLSPSPPPYHCSRDSPKERKVGHKWRGDEDELDEEVINGGGFSDVIRRMFGYDPKKRAMNDLDDDRMEASFDEIVREEKRSEKIGKQEDLLEERRQRAEEEARRKRLKG